MVLTGKKTLLSPLTQEDIPDMHRLFVDPQVMRYNTLGAPENIEATRKILAPMLQIDQEATAISWSIRQHENNLFAGEIGISLAPKRYRMAEIHYSLLPDYWGLGLASEAVHNVVEYCFRTLDLHRIEAGVAVENLASIRLLERTGFTREGRKRKILPLQNGWSDNFHYGLLVEDVRF